MKRLILILLALCTITFAVDLSGSFSTSFHMGTPYWNSDNYSEGNEIDTEDSYMRTLNQLRLNGKFGDNFRIKLSALRSDGFQPDNRLSETKIYQVYGQYDFKGGNVKAGRFVPFNRWIWGSVDGAAASYAITDAIKLNVLGGMHMPYGLLYDSDNSTTVVYSDLAMKFGKYGGKLKFYNDDDLTKMGADFYGRNGKLRYSGSYGYDVTNQRIADGGLGLMYYFNQKLSFVGNYRLFTIFPGKIAHFEFENQLIDRALLGISYRLSQNYALNLRQMVTMTADKKDYLSYATFSHKYFTLGLSYLTGDTDVKRMGLIAAANYQLFKGFKLSAGVAPVDYLLQGEDEHFTSIAYYFRGDYRIFSSLCINANFHYYQFDDKQSKLPLESNIRGGLKLNYFFGS